MRYEHDALTAILAPGFRPMRMLWPLLVVVPGYVGLLAGLGMAWVVPVSIAFLGLMAVLGTLVWRARPRVVEVRVDARWLTVTPVPSGRPRRISLLDLHRAVALREGWLLLEPQPGPLTPVWVDAGRTVGTAVQDLATEINAAIGRTRHRGDAPDESTRAVERLLRQPE